MRDDLALSEDASDETRKIHKAIVKVLGSDTYTGGCRAFYTPQEWRERGEKYGTESKLIVCHDGGALTAYFNYDYMDYPAIERMTNALADLGYFAQPCTSWYTAIYPI